MGDKRAALYIISRNKPPVRIQQSLENWRLISKYVVTLMATFLQMWVRM